MRTCSGLFPGERSFAAGADDPIPLEEPVSDSRDPISEEAEADEEGNVGGPLEVGNPIPLIPAPGAPADVGGEIGTTGYRCPTGGAPVRSGLQVLATGRTTHVYSAR